MNSSKNMRIVGFARKGRLAKIRVRLIKILRTTDNMQS